MMTTYALTCLPQARNLRYLKLWAKSYKIQGSHWLWADREVLQIMLSWSGSFFFPKFRSTTSSHISMKVGHNRNLIFIGAPIHVQQIHHEKKFWRFSIVSGLFTNKKMAQLCHLIFSKRVWKLLVHLKKALEWRKSNKIDRKNEETAFPIEDSTSLGVSRRALEKTSFFPSVRLFHYSSIFIEVLCELLQSVYVPLRFQNCLLVWSQILWEQKLVAQFLP
jgi:hypothetical protein